MKRRNKAMGNDKKVVFQKFESVTELSEFIKNTPQTKEGKDINGAAAESERKTDFTGTRTFDEANNLLLFGDSENAEKVRKYISRLTEGLNGKNKSFRGAKTLSYNLKSSAVGFLPIVPKLLAGEPENMLTLHKVQKKTTKVLNIFIYIGVSSKTEAEKLNLCLCRILCAVSGIEKEGFRVNIFAFLSVSCEGGVLGFSVKIKDSGQKIDLLKIAYPLCHPSSLRRHGFAVFERIDGSKQNIKLQLCYGYPEHFNEAKETLKTQGLKNFALVSYETCKDRNVGAISDFIKSQF